MSKKKWLMIVVLGLAVGVMGVVLIGYFILQGGHLPDFLLPVYTSDQTDSTHAGYRRSTVMSGSAVYVNDYEEYSLRLINPDPTQVVGLRPYGGGKICAIPGQKPTAYLAVDCGSEMPSYEVYRNIQAPPFDWRAATFQKMQLAMLLGPAANKLTTDQTVIKDVLRTLKEGTPAIPPSLVASNISGLYLFSDQLPGLVFCPDVSIDQQSGQVYLAESYAVEYSNSTDKIHGTWIPASPLFTQWVQTR